MPCIKGGIGKEEGFINARTCDDKTLKKKKKKRERSRKGCSQGCRS